MLKAPLIEINKAKWAGYGHLDETATLVWKKDAFSLIQMLPTVLFIVKYHFQRIYTALVIWLKESEHFSFSFSS